MILLILFHCVFSYFDDKIVVISLMRDYKLHLATTTNKSVKMINFNRTNCIYPYNTIFIEKRLHGHSLVFPSGKNLKAIKGFNRVELKLVKLERISESEKELYNWHIIRNGFGFKLMNGSRCLEMREEGRAGQYDVDLRQCADISEQLFNIHVCEEKEKLIEENNDIHDDILSYKNRASINTQVEDEIFSPISNISSYLLRQGLKSIVG